MINISVIGNSLVIANGGDKSVYPLNSIFLKGDDKSDLVNVRLRASRRNVETFLYQDVENLTAGSATEMIDRIAELANK